MDFIFNAIVFHYLYSFQLGLFYNGNINFILLLEICAFVLHPYPLLFSSWRYLSLFCHHLSPFKNISMLRLHPHTSSLGKSILWIKMRITKAKMRSLAILTIVWCSDVWRGGSGAGPVWEHGWDRYGEGCRWEAAHGESRCAQREMQGIPYTAYTHSTYY